MLMLWPGAVRNMSTPHAQHNVCIKAKRLLRHLHVCWLVVTHRRGKTALHASRGMEFFIFHPFLFLSFSFAGILPFQPEWQQGESFSIEEGGMSEQLSFRKPIERQYLFYRTLSVNIAQFAGLFTFRWRRNAAQEAEAEGIDSNCFNGRRRVAGTRGATKGRDCGKEGTARSKCWP